MSSAILTMDDVFELPDGGVKAAQGVQNDTGQEPRLAAIRGLAHEIEAQVLLAAMQAEGIFCHVQSHVETAHSRLFVPQRSWGSLIVRLDEAERAVELINAVRTTAHTPQADLPEELREDEEA